MEVVIFNSTYFKVDLHRNYLEPDRSLNLLETHVLNFKFQTSNSITFQFHKV